MVSEKRSEERMRDLVLSIGGPLWPGENRKSWLARVARKAGITARAAKAAFYGELKDDHLVFWKLRQLGQQLQQEERAARDELAELRGRVAILESLLVASKADAAG